MMRIYRNIIKDYLTCIIWLGLILAINSFDPNPLQDFCVADLTQGNVFLNGYPCKNPKEVEASDFVYKGLVTPPSTDNRYGFNSTKGHVENFPAVNTLGISMNRGEFAPGGVNQPHIHPRATEIVFVMEGTILAGIITTNKVLYTHKLEKGEVFVNPKGLVHFQINVGETRAVTITALNSQLPGAQDVAPSLFDSNPPVPEDVLAKAFQISNDQVKELMYKQRL